MRRISLSTLSARLFYGQVLTALATLSPVPVKHTGLKIARLYIGILAVLKGSIKVGGDWGKKKKKKDLAAVTNKQ